MRVKKIIFAFFCIFAGSAHAGTTIGKVGNLFINTGNDVISFSMSSASQNFANCAQQQLYSVTTTTQAGKNVYSAVLAAKASGQSIQVVGASTCNLAPNSGEDVIYIAVLIQ